MLTRLYEIQKNGTDEPICRAGIEMQMEGTDLWTQGWGKGGSGMNRDSSFDICTLPRVKQLASGQLQHSSMAAQCSVMTERGGMGWGTGDLRGKGHMYAYD